MKVSPRKSQSFWEFILSRSISVAHSVLDECERDKRMIDYHLWVFALLAKICNSCDSIQTLVKSGQIPDAMMILRVVHDATVMIEFILHDPSQSRKLKELFVIEMAEDNYEQVKFASIVENLSIEDLVKKYPSARRRVENYERAKKHPAFGASPREWPKRWRNISIGEMRKALSTGKVNMDLIAVISKLGNAFAHSRPWALQDFVVLGTKKTAHLERKPLNAGLVDGRGILRWTAAHLLVASSQIAEHYCLGQPIQWRIYKVGVKVAPGAFHPP